MNSELKNRDALLLLSGGQDSMTCYYWARSNFRNVEAVFFHYEQRHHLEYRQARALADAESFTLHELDVPAFRQIGGTAMIEDTDITTGKDGLPNTFVPGRNIVFLTLAASLAYRLEIHDIVIGVNEMDYSGYPDCRKDFIRSLETSLSLGLDTEYTLHSPLAELDKAGIWRMAEKFGVLEKIKKESHSCYLGDRDHFHDWGYGCGECPACKLRAGGWHKYLEEKRN